jgi:hypothetical protein
MVGRLLVSLNEVLGTISHVVCCDMQSNLAQNLAVVYCADLT